MKEIKHNLRDDKSSNYGMNRLYWINFTDLEMLTFLNRIRSLKLTLEGYGTNTK